MLGPSNVASVMCRSSEKSGQGRTVPRGARARVVRRGTDAPQPEGVPRGRRCPGPVAARGGVGRVRG